jgi:hypothetical protein
MPIPLVLATLARQGLGLLADAVIAKGRTVVEDKLGVQLPDDPAALTPEKLAELQAAMRAHERDLLALTNADRQAEHHETQETVRAGDRAEDPFVRRTRPGQSWVSLAAALAYVFTAAEIDPTILGLLLTLPWAYAGLRQIGKGVDALAAKGRP